jgi:hypothetical protein
MVTICVLKHLKNMELEVIQNKIHEIRGCKVMFDFDLALLYNVENKRLNCYEK